MRISPPIIVLTIVAVMVAVAVWHAPPQDEMASVKTIQK
jgi:hypothetical protein